MPPVLFPSLRGYRRVWLGADLFAALTLFAIALPEQLATSRLAGMPPVTGLYAFVAGTFLIAAIGSNGRLSVGADSTIAPLFAVGVAHLAATGSARYIDLVGILAVLVGAIVVLVGLLRLGWIAEFLSAPIITGFLVGVAVIIVVHQLPDLLGLPPTGGSTLHRLHSIAANLGSTNAWTLAVGLGALAVIVVGERLDHHIPGPLVALVASTVAVHALGLRRHGVAVLGAFAHGAPRLGLAGVSWSAVREVLPLAGVVALVVISQTAATTRAFPDDDDKGDINRDFIGTGAGSIAAGFVGSFPVDASPARTAAVTTSGGRTQLTGLVAAAVVVVAIPLTGLLRDLPLATLAAILLFVAGRIFHARELRAIARFDMFEFGLALVTLLTVAVVGVEQGIGVAVALAIVDRARLTARPTLHVLGRIPGTTSWAPLTSGEHPVQVPGVLAVLFATPLWYGNAEHFRSQVLAALAAGPAPPRLFVLDAVGMTDIDFTGTIALRSVLDHLDHQHIAVAVARVGERMRDGLEKSGLLDRIGPSRLFPSVDEAVTNAPPFTAPEGSGATSTSPRRRGPQ